MQLIWRLRSGLLLLGCLTGSWGLALPMTDSNTSVRALGMGNAYLAAVKNSDSLFYNPAGLARVSGFNWTIVDPRVGASGVDAIDDAADLQSDTGFSDAVQALYGEHVWVGGGGKSAVTFKGFGFAVYDTLDTSFAIKNPVYPSMDVSAINDFGYALGVGLPVLPIFHLGFVAKYIQRTGSRETITAAELGMGSVSVLENILDKEGDAYSFDLGTNFLIPLGPVEAVMALVWKDVGDTSFRNEETNNPPVGDRGDMSVGFAVDVDLPLIAITPAIDFRYLNREDIQMSKKVNLGVEIGLPLIDLRAGFHQGYYSLGAGFGFGPIQVDAATYGVELGEYPGQIEDRRYVVQATIEIGIPSFDFLSGGSGDGKKSGAGGGGGVGGRRLKQRR